MFRGTYLVMYYFIILSQNEFNDIMVFQPATSGVNSIAPNVLSLLLSSFYMPF